MKTISGPRSPRTFRFTCNNPKCRAVLEASEGEGRFNSDQRDGSYFVFVCPHCNKDAYVDDSVGRP